MPDRIPPEIREHFKETLNAMDKLRADIVGLPAGPATSRSLSDAVASLDARVSWLEERLNRFFEGVSQSLNPDLELTDVVQVLYASITPPTQAEYDDLNG